MSMEAYKGKELVVVHANRPGAGARVYGVVAAAGINVQAFCGYSVGDQAVLTMVTENNAGAKKALKKAGLSVDEREVLCVLSPHRPGVFFEIAIRLGEAGIDIDYAYASVAGKARALVVLQTNDDRKATRILSK
jgi:hypothetical protein